MERKWEGFIKDGVQYLEYKTKEDELVRNSHAVLNGIIRPIDDDFWMTHTPPILEGQIQYNCRCTLVPSKTPQNRIDLIVNKNQLNTNVGLTKIIFPESLHPYFKVENATVKNHLFRLAEKILEKI